MKYPNYQEASRGSWTTEADAPNLEQLKFGALQRIANATEVTARSVTALIQSNQHLTSEKSVLQHQLRAAKGQITKLRKQLAEKAT